jgi:hypothetical protein
LGEASQPACGERMSFSILLLIKVTGWVLPRGRRVRPLRLRHCAAGRRWHHRLRVPVAPRAVPHARS